MDFELYRMHVEKARKPLDRREEDKLLRKCGNTDWALKMRALLLGHHVVLRAPLEDIEPGYLLGKLDAAGHGMLLLDGPNTKYYYTLKFSALAAAMHVVVGE